MRTVSVFLSQGNVVDVVFNYDGWYVTDGDGLEVDPDELTDDDRFEIEMAIDGHLQVLQEGQESSDLD